ncbi:class I SAM-dependent methyltransferase [Halobacillus sp. ACCC02827]|nr:class I SAM-dependent methyltransferase [Halobacillus sp. ACCC02827]WJE16148.1 class I SAM-dependent methyltransferase [Halobacillus sp. ACCC02827]
MLYEQFAKPEGWIGKLAGKYMERENEALNEWTIHFLTLEEGDRVLEIGFGSGGALKKALEVPGIHLFGIDPSEAMVYTALRHLHKRESTADVCLYHGEASQVTTFTQPLDKVYAVNNSTYWEKPLETLLYLRGLMRRNGKIALTIRPHEDGAGDDTAELLGGQLQALLVKAGFQQVRIHLRDAKPNDAVCVTGMA